MSHSSTPAMSGFRIRITRENSSTAEHPLEDGRSIFLGSGSSCGIQIEGDGIAAIHCLIDVEDQVVSVQDWASDAGTIVNGVSIDDKVTINPGDVVKLGGITFEVVGQKIERVEEPVVEEPREESVGMESVGLEENEQPRSDGEFDNTAESSSASNTPLQPLVQVPANRLSELLGTATADTPETAPAPDAATTNGAPATDSDSANIDCDDVRPACDATMQLDADFDFGERVLEDKSQDAACSDSASDIEENSDHEPSDPRESDQLIDAEEAISELDEAFGDSTDDDSKTSFGSDAGFEEQSSPGLTAEDLDWDPECLDEEIDPEIVQLLKNEIEDLRIQVAERDEQLATLQHMNEEEQVGTTNVSNVEEGSTELVSRVDDLLAELEEHDERVATMQELLQTAEIQNDAEREERSCLETWVGEIEQRISERESEWQAEIDALRERYTEACEQRDDVQQKFHAATQRYGKLNDQEVVPDETLKTLQEENAKLKEELDAAKKESLSLTNQLERAQSEEPENLQELRAELAQEKASVSRMRFELSKQLQDLGDAPAPKDQPDREFAYKLQTLRAHLREIHEEEKQEREEKGESLFGRISGLWKRVEDKY